VANAVHPTRLPESKGLRVKATALATLLGILQSSTGYRPLQLYPAILKAAYSLMYVLFNNIRSTSRIDINIYFLIFLQMYTASAK